jgi:hypothetical protein
MMDNVPPTVKVSADVAAAGIAGGSLLGLLPNIAAALSILWLLIQIGDWAWKKWRTWR